jgi:regulator of protease activity HflC (stomatin/prohibitin superfamily)
MFGIYYFKAPPTQYILYHQSGRLRRKGSGLAFYYYRPSTSIASIPLNSADVPFIFNEISADNQPLTVQGQLTYRITQPEKVAALLDYSVDRTADNYLTEDPQKLSFRLVNLLQVLTRAEVEHLPLEQAVHAYDEVSTALQARLAESQALSELGVEVLAVSILAIRPTPESERAMEAQAREELLRKADLAIYERRNAAVEQERRIKENELNTEIAIEEKKRQIRETKVEADLAVEAKEQQVRQSKLAGQIRLEQERAHLVSAHVENARAEADVQSYAVEASLRPLRELDSELVQMLEMQSAEPRLMVSMALKELAHNAGKIGNLNISPELLESLMVKREG